MVDSINGLNFLSFKIKQETGTGVTTLTDNIPLRFSLQQNYPNPFNPSTTIEFSLPKPSFVTLKVYDVLGKEITELINEEKPAGMYILYSNFRRGRHTPIQPL